MHSLSRTRQYTCPGHVLMIDQSPFHKWVVEKRDGLWYSYAGITGAERNIPN